MHSITIYDWKNLNIGNPKQTGFKVQEQINWLRHQITYASFAGLGTQSEYIEQISSKETNSSAGILSLNRLGVTAIVNYGNVNKWLDARDWIEPTDELAEDDNLVSEPSSSNKMSIPEWIFHIRNNLVSFNENEQMANRISLLAYDVETNEGVAIDEESLATFVMFLSSNKIERRPNVGLSSNGYIDALWRCSKDLLVEIIFLPGHESQIVTFSPDLVNPEVINKRVAILPISNITDVISSRNLDSLFSYSKDHESKLVA